MLLSRNMVESIYENDGLTASGLPIFVQVLELLMEALQQLGAVKKTGTRPNTAAPVTPGGGLSYGATAACGSVV